MVNKFLNEGEGFGSPNNLDLALSELYAHKLMREKQKAEEKTKEEMIRLTLQVLRKENYDIPYTPIEIIKKIKDYSF